MVKGGRVVVEREHEAGVLEAGARLGADDDPAVGALPCGCRRAVRERALPGAAAAHQAQAVRPRRGDDVLEHVRTTLTTAAEWCRALYLRPDEARGCRLAPVAPAKAAALSRRAAADGRDDGARRRRRRGRVRQRGRPLGLRHAQLLRGALSVAEPDHRARAARRHRLSQPLPRDRLRRGRRLRAPVPGPVLRRRLLERGDRARRRRRAAAAVRRPRRCGSAVASS